MTDLNQSAAWSMAKFYFSVNLGAPGLTGSFQEVIGLDLNSPENQAGEPFTLQKMPGSEPEGTLILKKGIFMDYPTFRQFEEVIRNEITWPQTVIIQLSEEEGDELMTWSLSNAWPVSFVHKARSQDADGIAIETMELKYRNITIGGSK